MPNRRKKLGASSNAKARSGNAGKIADLFGVRPGTNRETVLKVLVPKMGKPVSRATICKALYNSTKAENVPALEKVVLGLKVIASENKLPFHFEHVGRGDEAGIAMVKGRKSA